MEFVGAVALFLFSQLVIRFVLDPIQEQRRCIAEVATVLVKEADRFSNPPFAIGAELNQEYFDSPAAERQQETKDAVRRCAADLRATLYVIPGYRWLEQWGVVPSRAKIARSASLLIGISNLTFVGDGGKNHESATEVRRLLGIPEE